MEIVLKDVSKTINSVNVLNSINVSFESGKIYGLRGHNGSGKTMLLRMLCGLLRPGTGHVYIDGQELGKDMDYPPSVGLMIENPAFLGNFSALKNLQMIASLKGRIDEKHIIEVLNIVGLGENLNLKYKKFSLGMKQRLGIAAAIMESPDLLLLDEPTNALDTAGIDMVTRIIHQMKSPERLIIIASHETEFLDNIADVIFEIENGCIKQGE